LVLTPEHIAVAVAAESGTCRWTLLVWASARYGKSSNASRFS
jgi:hypothetical protein